MFNFGFKQNNSILPREDLLVYIKYPNSDDYQVGEDTEIGEDTYIWGFELDTSLFSELGECLFFNSEGTAIVKLATEIIADSATNNSNILFKMKDTSKQLGRLAIYKTTVSNDVLIKAKKVLRII